MTCAHGPSLKHTSFDVFDDRHATTSFGLNLPDRANCKCHVRLGYVLRGIFTPLLPFCLVENATSLTNGGRAIRIGTAQYKGIPMVEGPTERVRYVSPDPARRKVKGTVMFGLAKNFVIKASVLLTVTAGLAGPAFAAKPPSARQLAQVCGQAPIVQVVENIQQPVVTTRKPASYSKKIKAGWRIQGLAELKRSFKANFQWEMLNTAAGSCLRIKSVQVQTGVIPPQIWINPSIRRNSCEYKVTLGHELEHVKNHNAYIRQFSNDVRRNLASRLRNKSGMVINAGTDKSISQPAQHQTRVQ